MIPSKLFFFVYNSFQNGDLVLSLLKYIFVTNKILNKIGSKYSFDLAILKYINVYINYRLLEKGWDILVCTDYFGIVIFDNWNINL